MSSSADEGEELSGGKCTCSGQDGIAPGKERQSLGTGRADQPLRMRPSPGWKSAVDIVGLLIVSHDQYFLIKEIATYLGLDQHSLGSLYLGDFIVQTFILSTL